MDQTPYLLRDIVATVRESFVVLDSKLHVLMANQSFLNLFKNDVFQSSFKIRVEQLSTISLQLARETELMGLNERDAELKKMRWAIEDENLKMQLDLQKQIAIEETKNTDEARKKIDVLKESNIYCFISKYFLSNL
jgi:hypothetical protein